MAEPLFELTLDTPDATGRFAAHVGSLLEAGDVVLLEGEIGAGKTHFARSLIQSLQSSPGEVPSPTFTLIQAYDTRPGEVIHADLYRLSGPADIAELGLLEAFGTQICLVEWPDRLGPDRPDTALTLTFSHGAGETTRLVRGSGHPEIWAERLGNAAHV